MCKRIRNMKVYISGKIGEEVLSVATIEKFARAEAMLRAKGHEPFNPTSEEWQSSLIKGYAIDIQQAPSPKDGPISKYAYFLLRDQMAMANKDAVYFLEDWEKSPGAQSEHSFAMAIGKKLLWQRQEDAMVYRDDNENPEDVWLPIREEVCDD